VRVVLAFDRPAQSRVRSTRTPRAWIQVTAVCTRVRADATEMRRRSAFAARENDAFRADTSAH
jgi:hypothetical protein